MRKPCLAVAVAGATALLLGACAPSHGVVSDFNGASVKIRQDTVINVPGATPQIQAEADRACATVGKRAEHVSVLQPADKSYAEQMFLCV